MSTFDWIVGIVWGAFLLSLVAVVVTVVYAIWGGEPRLAATAIVLAMAFGFAGNVLDD